MQKMIIQKGQEIAFAVIKIAAYIRRTELRQRIEKLSYDLLQNMAFSNPETILPVFNAIRQFIILGKNLYEIEPVNAKILERELESLETDIRQISGLAEKIDAASLFTVKVPIKKQVARSAPEVRSKNDFQEVIIDDSEIGNEPVTSELDNTAEYTAKMRQDKIMELLGSAISGKLQLRDFIAVFPELSERTIRNDLKILTDSGKIMRQGDGGPSNYYVIKIKEEGYPQLVTS